MNWNGIILVVMGAIELLYAVLCRDKVNYYVRRYKKKFKMTIINIKEFLILQLKYFILNSAFSIALGILIMIFNLHDLFIFAGILIFHFIVLILVIESRKKGYVDYEVGGGSE
jgi:hypothetical protein